MLVILLGPPGVGKGAVARKLKDAYAFEIISSGELLRREIRENTEIGRQVEPLVSAGALVPDDLIINMVKERLLTRGNIILEGFPRNVRQADALEQILEDNGLQLDLALIFNAPEDVLKTRLQQRRICTGCNAVYHMINCPPIRENICNHCGSPLTKRLDDDEVLFRTRLERYLSSSSPLIDHYRDLGILKDINADLPLLDVYYQVLGSNVKFTQESF